jgi:signal transduction histidine kinase
LVIHEGIVADGDPRRLRVALEDLLGNAWKFTARQPKATISFGSVDRDGETVYFVGDDGPGFDMAEVESLFTPFQRLSGAAEYEGVGVGLATVKWVVDAHGGRIWAEAAVDEGARFYFTLA